MGQGDFRPRPWVPLSNRELKMIREELEQFGQFVEARLTRDGAESQDLEDYLRLWRRQREREESVADIHQSLAELESGNGATLAETLTEFEERLSQQSSRRTA